MALDGGDLRTERVSRSLRGVRVFGRVVTLSILLGAATSGADAAESTPCVRIDAVRRAAPDPAECPRRAGITPLVVSSDAATTATATALFARAEERIVAGQFEEAEQTLDCAESVLHADDDAIAHYELVRRRGILDYRRERIPEALERFECALELSTAREDRSAIARDLKNVGSALRRLGDFRGALRRLAESLDLQRADGGDALGPVLNNIGDVYRELEEPETALRYYREALADFQRRGNPVEAAHVLETLSVLALDRGDSREAARLLETALAEDRQTGNRPYRLRIYAGLTRLAIAEGDLAKAERWRSAGLSMADEYDLTLPAALELEAARVDRLGNRYDFAKSRLRSAIARLPENDTDRPALLRELAASLESEGDTAAALAVLRQTHTAELRLAESKYDRQLAWARSRFEAAEREHKIAVLERDSRLRSAMLRQRTLLLWSTIASALALLSLLVMFFLRRQQQARIAEAARQARHDEELARYRQQAVALGVDHRLLKALFDDRTDAVCVIDAEGSVLTLNRAACELLAIAEDAMVGRDFADCLQHDRRDEFHAALVRMEDTATLQLAMNQQQGGAQLSLRLSEWERDGGLILLTIAASTSSSSSPVDAVFIPTSEAGASSGQDDASQQAFRRALVELMLATVDAWERGTGHGRLELAEKSRIWRVTIDDGRLRARSMERYLNLSKLPQNPRWRDVLRSAYFVLGQCEMDAATRAALQSGVDAVLAYTRRSALA
jgi:two-component system, sensor histidine kinase ChiS